MKISIVSDGASWVLDNIKEDFQKFTSLEVVKPNQNPDIVWSLDFWSLKRAFSFRKPVVGHVHHINKDQISKYNFEILKNAIGCITCNKHTFKELSERSINGKIRQIPYWVLSKTMEDVNRCENNQFFNIGSFQKDGQTKSNKPKLIKGPDIFIDAVEKINKNVEVNVILAGYCRGYVISELERRGIRYEIHEKAKDLNPLYDRLDAYIISSRAEGGPQAVLEAAYRKVPVISTDVGMVSDVIHPNCICKADEISEKISDCKYYIMYNYESALNYRPEVIVPKFDLFFKELLNGV